ncbi:MAG: HEPN domain-containing protein [Isosphaeraceae bacterium]
MTVPQSKEARFFYRCALQRFDEARVLLDADRTTGAVYLAGYGVECMLKALILSAVPPSRTYSVLQTFRGHRAHDFQWLRDEYRLNGGAHPPREVNRCFTLVDRWSTEMRYSPGNIKERDAERFFEAAQVILGWSDGRL